MSLPPSSRGGDLQHDIVASSIPACLPVRVGRSVFPLVPSFVTPVSSRVLAAVRHRVYLYNISHRGILCASARRLFRGRHYRRSSFSLVYHVPARVIPPSSLLPHLRNAPTLPSIRVYADMVELRSGKTHSPIAPGVRGACVGFSSASRRRLMRCLAKIRSDGYSLSFVTLTYPGEWSDDWHRWKRDIDVFLKRLARYGSRQPGFAVGGVWRVEFQRRGAPHYHLILWSRGSVPKTFKAWLSRSWYEAVGSGDERHLRAGTQVQALENRQAVRCYVSKYVAKVGDGEQPAGWGRNWAKFGNLDDSPYVEGDIEPEQFVLIRRLIRSCVKSRVRGYKSPGSALRYVRYLGQAEVVQALNFGAESSLDPVIGRMIGYVLRDAP